MLNPLRKKHKVHFTLCFGLFLVFSGPIAAVEKVKSNALIEIVDDALAIHPLMQLAQAKLDQAKAESRAKGQPLYNPELALQYESNVDDIRTIGISQTIDWSDKQGAQKKIGQQNLLSAEAEFVSIRQSIAANFLKKINRFQTTMVAAELNSQQTDTLSEFVKIAKQRFKVGDISQVELDLALLAAGEIRMKSAKIQADYFSAETELDAFLNFKKILIPDLDINLVTPDLKSVEEILQEHPRLMQLRIASKAAKSAISLASRKKNADPTLSINAGKEGSANIVNVGFSMPLFVRNNFSAQVDSAIANSVAVEQAYLNSYREVLVAVKSTKNALELTLNAYREWVNQTQSGLEQRGKLLQKLWKSGELETTDYLVQIQQTLDTQIAATQLKADVINAWIDYLIASGQMDGWLGLAKN